MYNKIQFYISSVILLGVWSNLFYQIKQNNKNINKKLFKY